MKHLLKGAAVAAVVLVALIVINMFSHLTHLFLLCIKMNFLFKLLLGDFHGRYLF